MARCALGPKKVHRISEQTGNHYEAVLARGGGANYLVVGVRDARNADTVNRMTGEWEPLTRDGRFVSAAVPRNGRA
jgi:hypothetical protein